MLMKKCIKCGKHTIKNQNHDLCYDCWQEKEKGDFKVSEEESFEDSLGSYKIHTVYIMSYGINKYKVGYTNDLNSRIFELKSKYPRNKLIYFREFVRETEARRFEAWLKGKNNRELHKFITSFQDKVNKLNMI